MKKTWLLAASLAALASFGLAACGDDNGSSADEDQISAAIDRAATSGDPAACTDVQTVRFIQQTSGDEGDSPADAIKTCERDAADSVADEVDVTDIEVDGDTATAKAAVTGSFFDGQTLDIALVKEGDQWKLDEFKGFDDFDPDAMAAAVKQEISSEPDATPQAADCVSDQIKNLPEDQVEAAFVGNDSQAEDRLFGPCSKFFKGG